MCVGTIVIDQNTRANAYMHGLEAIYNYWYSHRCALDLIIEVISQQPLGTTSFSLLYWVVLYYTECL